MFKTRNKESVIRPLVFTNPFFTSGPRTTLKTTTSQLPTGVYSVEARDRDLDAKRTRERVQTGALSAKELMYKTIRQAEAKRKFISQIVKLVRNQALTEEVAQRINALAEANQQWRSNKRTLVADEAEIIRQIRQRRPGVSDAVVRAAINLAENNGIETIGALRKRRQRSAYGDALGGYGKITSALRVPRIFELTKPESVREERPINLRIDETNAKDNIRQAQQSAYRKYLTYIHGTEPPSDMVKDAYPTTAEPLVAVSTPKPNPTVKSNKLHSHTPFIVSRW